MADFYTDKSGNLHIIRDGVDKIVKKYTKVMGDFKFPWETTDGEGFLAPWTPRAATMNVDDDVRHEEYTEERASKYVTKLTFSEAMELEKVGHPIPRGVEIAKPTFAESQKLSQPEEVEEEAISDMEAMFKARQGRPNVESIGGYDYQSWGADGERIYSDEPIGRSELDDISAWQQAQLDENAAARKAKFEETEKAAAEKDRYQMWEQSQREKEFNAKLEQDRLDREAAQKRYDREFAADSAYRDSQTELQQQRLAWEQEQFAMQQEQAKQQRLSQLAAQPITWLQYASESGNSPVIQPWMLPLMPQDAGYNVGEQIPDWSATDMTAMPELATPSAQLTSRMGPTANAQLVGYEQARTGATQEEQQFRRWNYSPPGGRFSGISRRQ